MLVHIREKPANRRAPVETSATAIQRAELVHLQEEEMAQGARVLEEEPVAVDLLKELLQAWLLKAAVSSKLS